MWYNNISLKTIFFILITSTIDVRSASSSSSSIPCSLPNLKNKSFSVSCPNNKTETVVAGNVPASCFVTVNCNLGFAINEEGKNTSVSVCLQGQWYPKIPECKKICRTWKPSANLKLSCFTNEAKQINCTQNLLSGTKIKQNCAENYRVKNPAADYDEIVCKTNGEWDRPLKTCVPACGKTFVNLIPQLTGAKKETYGNAPWHVAVYNHKKVLICGGTIISFRVVLSAAHCFFDTEKSVPRNASSFQIAVSKVTRDYNSVDNRLQKFYKVKEIRYPKHYKGLETDFAGDIALILLDQEIEMSSAVLPACIELTNPLSNIIEGTLGKISGWGKDDSDRPSDILLTANLSYSSYENCIEKFSNDERNSINLDKFCGGSEQHNDPAVQQGDSGGGFLYFQTQLKSYYVLGVVSVKIGTMTPIGLFTGVQPYADWLKRTIRELDPESDNTKISELNKSCLLPNKENYRVFQIKCDKSNSPPKSEEYVAESCIISLGCGDLGGKGGSKGNSQVSQSVCIDGNWIPEVPQCHGIEECTIADNLPGMCTSAVGCPWSKNNTKVSSPTASTSECRKENNERDLKVCCVRCGKLRNSTKRIKRIVNGVPASLEKWPWMVALGFDRNATITFSCGGTLISDQWVITTGHCAYGYKDSVLAVVRVGDLDLGKTINGNVGEQEIPIDTIVPHPRYVSQKIISTSPTITENDIALIHLKHPVIFGANVRPICLPLGDEYKTNEFYEDRYMQIAGWGSTGFSESALGHLREVSLRVINTDKCKEKYRDIIAVTNIDKRVLCGGDSKGDACQGDSGGPMVMEIDGIYYLAGISSFGIGCANDNYPGVYMRIAHYADWINKEITSIW